MRLVLLLIAAALRVAPAIVLVGFLEFAGRKSDQERTWGRAGLFWLLTLPAVVLVQWAIGQIHIHPLFAWGRPSGLEVLLYLFLAGVIGDLFYYWLHRAMHVWLWRFHVVHHSIENLDAVSSYHHFTEEFFQALFVVVPVILLAPSIGQGVLPWAAFVGIQQTYIHSPAKLSIGPLRWVFVDNRYHRIHHSTDPKHFNKNFGVVTPLWDVLFGTAYFPGPGEWPDTGVAGYPEHREALGFLAAPLLRRHRRQQ